MIPARVRGGWNTWDRVLVGVAVVIFGVAGVVWLG